MMSKEFKKSSAKKRREKEILKRDKNCRYANMEQEKHGESAEKQFRHKPYGMGDMANE